MSSAHDLVRCNYITCDNLQSADAAPVLLKCTGCRSVSYCGVECQRADWPEHKNMCRAIQRQTRQNPAATTNRLAAVDDAAEQTHLIKAAFDGKVHNLSSFLSTSYLCYLAWGRGAVALFFPDQATARKLLTELRNRRDESTGVCTRLSQELMQCMTYVDQAALCTTGTNNAGVHDKVLEKFVTDYEPTAEFVLHVQIDQQSQYGRSCNNARPMARMQNMIMKTGHSSIDHQSLIRMAYDASINSIIATPLRKIPLTKEQRAQQVQKMAHVLNNFSRESVDMTQNDMIKLRTVPYVDNEIPVQIECAIDYPPDVVSTVFLRFNGCM